MGIGSAFSFFDKLMDKLPIQGRVERWKNQVDKLERRQNEIKIKMLNDRKSTLEYERNERKLRQLRNLLKNKAQD